MIQKEKRKRALRLGGNGGKENGGDARGDLFKSKNRANPRSVQ